MHHVAGGAGLDAQARPSSSRHRGGLRFESSSSPRGGGGQGSSTPDLSALASLLLRHLPPHVQQCAAVYRRVSLIRSRRN